MRYKAWQETFMTDKTFRKYLPQNDQKSLRRS